jgi:uncharacterized protein
MTASSNQLLLYGVFQELVARKMPLSVSDYLDLLRALDGGFGIPRAESLAWDAPGSGRIRLRRLCEILWARNDEDVRLISSVFAAIPLPKPAEASEIETRLTELEARARPKIEHREVHEPDFSVAMERQHAPPLRSDEKKVPALAVAFGAPRESDGIPLPRLRLAANNTSEAFILCPHALLPERTLCNLWRRFRTLSRSGPKTELDVDGTIAERSRRGVLTTAVLRPARVNRARLLILADVSPSMAPWHPFIESLARSLELGRLNRAAILYFANVPRRSVFQSPELTRGIRINDMFSEHAGASLMVVSDAGAARGYLNHHRVTSTATFLAMAQQKLRAVVWINPMPRPRWIETTAGRLRESSNTVFLPLDTASLIHAVDILRGAKSR